MRKLIISVCVVAGLGAGATAVAGCGADKAVGLDVSKAAAATAEKGTARVTLSTSVTGAGLPVPVEIKGKGVASLNKAEGNITLDLGPLIGLVGAPQGTPGDLEVRFRSGTVYVKPPKLDQLKIPGGRPWVSLELPKLATALGLPSKGLGKLFTLEPAAQLRALESAKGLKKVGKEDVGGTATTHYRGAYTLSDFLTTLPEAERAEVEQAIKKLDALAPGSNAGFDKAIPADLWVDKDGVTRRLMSTTKLPAQNGQAAGTIKQSYELSDFGAPLDAAPPAAGRTFDATSAISGALSSLAAAGGTAAAPTP